MGTIIDRAAGMPDYHGYFIPELWVPKMQQQFEKACVFMEIASTEYEELLQKEGDTVTINIEPTVTINDYVRGQKLNRETLDPEKVQLIIDNAKSYNVHVDDIDQKQSNINLIDEFALSAGRRMKEAIDKVVLQGIYNSEDSSNSGATAGAESSSFNLGTTGAPVSLTDNNIIDYITDVRTVLDEQDVPTDNRWMILPPVFTNLLLRSDIKDASFSGDSTSIAINGKLPKQVAGFDIYQSGQLKTGGSTYWYCPAGHKSALAFASQLVETRAIEANDTFGYYIDGLNVFGYKVVRDESLAIMVAERG